MKKFFQSFLNCGAIRLLGSNLSHNYAINDNKLPKKCIEIKIPVPWGKIVAKWWGPVDKRPILCMHGWQDNCDTYDRLIPLLPDHTSYLAIDYPGHGLSTKIPNGMFYHPSDFPLLLRRIQKYFEWPQMSILSHSLAANLSCIYASIYPNDIDLFIALDGIKPYSKEPGNFIEQMALNIDKHLKYDAENTSGNEPPAYTIDELTNKMYEGYRKSIDRDKCVILYKRNTLPSSTQPGKYYFSRDIRTKNGSIIHWQHEDLKEYIKRIKCPMIVIRTIGSQFVEDEKYLKDAVNIMKTNNKEFKYVEFEGKHHGHINEPENMVCYITEFLRKYDTGDRNLGGIQPGLILNDDSEEL